MIKVYLGGGIRRAEDNKVHPQDSEWRLQATAEFGAYGIGSFDPLLENAEVVDKWEKDNFAWDREILDEVYDNDERGMNESQIGVFDLRSLDEDYPNQGSLFEIGYLTAQGKCVIIATSNERIRHNPMYAKCVFVNHPMQFLSRVLPEAKRISDNIWKTGPTTRLTDLDIGGKVTLLVDGEETEEETLRYGNIDLPDHGPCNLGKECDKRTEDSGTQEEACG